jgi:hypothetical protein
MKSLLLGAALSLLAGSVAFAQDPAPAPKPNATPPANHAAPATPDMKAQPVPESAMPAPTATKNPAFIPDDNWVGRYVYSIDNKDLGRIAAVTANQLAFDMGGFLGIGATRKHVATDQISSVQSDRIILRMTKAEAEKLPADK